MRDTVEGCFLVDGFELREFQLYILAFMPDSERMTEALAALNATRDDAGAALESAKRIGLTQMRHKADLEFSILGDPVFSEYLKLEDIGSSVGVEGSKVHGFELPVFADYLYLVNVMANGFAWGQRFRRRPGAASPEIGAVEDLRTWKYLKDEVLGVLVDAVMVEGFSYNEVYSGTMVERRSGEQIEVLVGFDVDLLQWAEPAGPTSGQL